MGDRLRFARESAELSLEAVGEALGITGSAVSQWETGKTHPSRKSLVQFAELTSRPASASSESGASSNARLNEVRAVAMSLRLEQHPALHVHRDVIGPRLQQGVNLLAGTGKIPRREQSAHERQPGVEAIGLRADGVFRRANGGRRRAG